MTDKGKLIQDTGRDVQRLKEKASNPARFVVGIVLYGGTLGLLFSVPTVAGAYLGRWIDSLMPGYSVRWTISLVLLGIVVGAFSVMHFLRGKS